MNQTDDVLKKKEWVLSWLRDIKPLKLRIESWLNMKKI